MSECDKLRLKVGLEVHQQLNTKSKLFCNCPTLLSEDSRTAIIRELRPSLSELGEVDPAALFEWEKGKRYKYFLNDKSTCLVECDEEPPHPMNLDAILIGLGVTNALNGIPVDEIYVMRKMVIDGSNTSGFQRTAIIGIGGKIDDIEGPVGIQTIAIEEDAARKIETRENVVEYNLDRLGFPLIEISTSPDIRTPKQAERVALKIGTMLRLTKMAKRGIGTIRQDLNVSIMGGVKIEIKGVQKLEAIPDIIESECLRQSELLNIRRELERRLSKNELERRIEIMNLTNIFQNTASSKIRTSIQKGGLVLGIKLSKLRGILGWKLGKNRRFGTEIADYVRALAGLGGIFHSDELPAYGINLDEVNRVRQELKCEEDDAFILIVGEESNVNKAIEVIKQRITQAFYGIPKETRMATEDNDTKFLRPQPGSARMYPETDIPPIRVTEDIIHQSEKFIPPTPEVKINELLKLGVNKELAESLLYSTHLELFEELSKELRNISPNVVAITLVNTLKYVKSKVESIDKIDDIVITKVLNAVDKGIVNKDSIPQIFIDYCTRDEEIEHIISNYSTLSDQELNKIIREVVNESVDEIKSKGDKAFNIIMGKVMQKVRGKAEGRKVAELIKENINEIHRQ
ncbi:glutamyl-tRNA(Gln) amidotransferase subunit E [Sulfolobales archaeon HS-7]|nr:glutamyl-tRNA(Gln) amidotransferase subunit E [Sulfolobales archaeon HS-7]